MIDKFTMPFDQYQRYEICKRIIFDIKERKQRKLKILDVGGHFKTKEGVDWLPAVEFFGENDILVVDTTQASIENYQVSDGRDLPFEDNSFDIVVSNDVLEHVPPQGRYSFIKELTRVSKEVVIINFPYYTAKKALAEKILYEYIVNSSNGENRMLEEHLVNGLPRVSDVVDELNELSLPHSFYYSGDTDNWLKLMAVNYELSRIGQSNLQEMIDEYVNKHHFLGEMNLSEGYRVTFVIDKNGHVVKNNFFEHLEKTDVTKFTLPTEAVLTYFTLKKENESKSIFNSNYFDSDKVLSRMSFRDTIRQTFYCQFPNLFRLSFLVATYKESLQGEIKLSLIDPDSSERIVETTVDYSILKDNEWFHVDFTPLMHSQDKEYVIEITQTSSGLGPSFYCSEKNRYGVGEFNGEDTNSNLTIKTYCRKMNAAEHYFLIDQEVKDLKRENNRMIQKGNEYEKEIQRLETKLDKKEKDLIVLTNQIEERQKTICSLTDQYNDLIKIIKEI